MSILLMPIFQKRKSSETQSESVVRNLFQDQPQTYVRLIIISQNSLIYMSHIFPIAIFQGRKGSETHGKRFMVKDIFADRPPAPKVFQLVTIGQSFLINMLNISYCHISENKNFGILWETFHGQRRYSGSAISPKGIFD